MVVGQPPVFAGEDQCVESASAAPGRDAFGGVNAPHLCGSSRHEGRGCPAFCFEIEGHFVNTQLICAAAARLRLIRSKMKMLTDSEHLDTSSEWAFTHRNRQH